VAFARPCRSDRLRSLRRQASPPYLLATIGWFLLCALGQACRIHEAWGIALPEMAFGSGVFFYTTAILTILQHLHVSTANRGQPALFLFVAPPSVAVICLYNFGTATGGQALL
jgi:hypothetical protein